MVNHLPQHRQGLGQMFPGRSLSHCKFIAVPHTHAIGYQKPLGLSHVLLKISFAVGNQKTVVIGSLPEDSSTNKGMFSMRFDIFLNGDDLVPKLLQRQIMQIPGVHQFYIMPEVVQLRFGHQPLHHGHQFIGRAVRSYLPYEVFEGYVAGMGQL